MRIKILNSIAMKNFTKILTVFTLLFAVSLGVVTSCKKETSKEVKMNYSQLSKEIGADNAFVIFAKAGLTEEDPAARGSQRVKANATVITEEDLQLTLVSGNDYSSTTSPDGEWGAFQNLTDTQSACPQNWSNTTAPPSMSCTVPWTAGKILRTFTSDKATAPEPYKVHLSNRLTTQ